MLPKSFVKIRHYGLLANAQRAQRLALCRQLLLALGVLATLPSKDAKPIEPAPSRSCSRCGSNRLAYEPLPAPTALATVAADSS